MSFRVWSFCLVPSLNQIWTFPAAHCIQERNQDAKLFPDELQVLLGRHDIRALSESGSMRSNVIEIRIHPDWKSSAVRWDADLSVIVLENQIEFSNFIQPICLPIMRKIENINDGVVVRTSTKWMFNWLEDHFQVGWGASEVNQDETNIQRALHLKAVNDSYCFSSEVSFAMISSYRTFCAGGLGAGPCHGDSGNSWRKIFNEAE